MGEGIKYVFEIDSKAPGLDALLSKLEGAEKVMPKLADATERAGRAHGKHAAEAKGLEGALHRLVHAGMDPFLHKAKEIAEFEFLRRGVDALIEAPGEIIEKLKELGEEMINVAAKTERTNSSFGLLFGAEEGSHVLEYLESIAGATEFTDDRLKGAAQSLAKVGFEGENLTRALAASLDIAAFSPDKEGGFSEALASLERIKRTGHVDNRVLGGLGIGQDAFFKELSARTGEGIAGLKKKIETGKLDASDALETLYTMIAKKTGKDLGGAGVGMGKTLEARLTHLKDLPEQFFQKLAHSEGLGKFTGVVERALEGLSPDSPNGQKIFAGLEHAFTAVGDSLSKVDWESAFKKLGDVMADLPPKIDAIIGGFKGISPVILEAVEDVSKLVVGLAYLASMLPGGDHKSMKEVRAQNALDVETKAQADIDKLMSDEADKRHGDYTGEGVPEFLKKGKKLAEATGDGFVKGLKGATPETREAGAKLGDSVVGGAAGPEGVDAKSPSKKFERLGVMVGEGFVDGLDKTSGMLDNVMAGAFAVPAPAGGREYSGATTFTVGDINVTVGPGADAHEIAETVRDKILEAFEGLRAEMGV